MVAFTMIFFLLIQSELSLIVLFTIISGITTFFLIRYFDRKKIEKKIQRGIELEHEAAHFLKKQGYRIVSYHTPIGYTIKVNDVAISISLELDYIVSKHGKTYVAEVKSGEHTATIHYAQTRRQLLEYAVASKYDGYLLVDMHRKKIDEIAFPLDIQYATPSYVKYGIAMLGIAVCMLNFAYAEYTTIGTIAIVAICAVWFWNLRAK